MEKINYEYIDIEKIMKEFDMKPYGARVVMVERKVESVGRIIIANTNEEMRSKEGVVIDIGPDVAWDVKVGDVVYYGRYAGTWFERNGEKFILMNDEDLLGKVVEKGEQNAG